MEKLINCPICNSNKTTNMLNLECGNFDNSALYQSVKINVCAKCGHVYNRLSLDEIDGLIKYYNEEYALLNLASTDKIGDRPGSNSYFTVKRHAELYTLIEPYINTNYKVLDVGCSTGGFLEYLHKQGLNNLYGIDIIEEYVQHAKENNVIGDIKLGSASAIPFEDNTFDLVVLDQVMEHLVDPKKALKEAKRVLVDDGLLCIGVPDAARYVECYFSDFYFFLMREHIQHFDLEHLELLAEQEGFELVKFTKRELPMMSDKMILPNLNAVFRMTDKPTGMQITGKYFLLKQDIGFYISFEFEKLHKKRDMIGKLLRKPLYVWGIGREFLYLYENAGLRYCDILCLIDTNTYKQKTFTVDGRGIRDKTILEEATQNSALIIAAIAHTEEIKADLLDMGYGGDVIEV